jgi:hypothetical protein
MKYKIKANLIEWLYVLMLFPIGIIIITLFFMVLAILVSDVPQVIPWDQIFIEGIILISFIILYLIIVIFYKKFIIFEENSISLSNKDGSTTYIKNSDIMSMNYYKTPIYLIPLTLLTNGNTLVVDFMNENNVQESIRVKLFYRTIKRIKESLRHNIEIKKPKFNK